jgi:hypothetical protein
MAETKPKTAEARPKTAAEEDGRSEAEDGRRRPPKRMAEPRPKTGEASEADVPHSRTVRREGPLAGPFLTTDQRVPIGEAIHRSESEESPIREPT